MIRSRFVRQSLFMLCLVMVVAACANTGHHPDYNLPGKDVVWWPTPQVVANKMLDMANVTPEDYVIDLGSGDGRTVIIAAKRGTRALGIEYNPDLVALSKSNAAREGVTDKAQFIQGDLFESDFSQATVITLFLGPAINLKLRPRILDLRPGTRVVSNTFTMGEWIPDQSVTVEGKEGCSVYCTALLWIVPANVEGTWKLPQGELTLKQSFQTFSGTLKSNVTTVPVTNGKLRGDLITFSVGTSSYNGRVHGSAMQGTFSSAGSTAPWNATRNQ
ncbi:MAG: class I SAM-dependent methyltransferase [Deltaproteobacteria bacterium]